MVCAREVKFSSNHDFHHSILSLRYMSAKVVIGQEPMNVCNAVLHQGCTVAAVLFSLYFSAVDNE